MWFGRLNPHVFPDAGARSMTDEYRLAGPKCGHTETVTGKESVAVSVVEWKKSARALAESMGLTQAVRQYTSLAFAAFNVIGSVNVEASNDPETDDCYLAIDFRVSGSVDEVLALEERFQKAAVRELPMNKLFRLRLSYELI